MSYERELIAENTQALTTQPQIQMREERVVDPYRVKPPRAADLTNKIGQIDKIASATPEEPVAKAEESLTLAPAAAALARKEQKFRQQEQDLKVRELALDKERAEIADLKATKAKLANKDYSGIENLVKYDEYTNYLIEKEQGTDPSQEAIKKLEAEVREVKEAQKSDVDKRYEAAVNERRKVVADLVAKDESYPSIKKLKYEEHVVQHILDTWENDNVDLSPEQAAKEVEEILQAKAKEWASLLKQEAVEAPAEKILPPLKAGIKTLTNNVTQSGELKRPNKSFQGMSDAERYAEAKRRAEEKLKQGIR